MEKDNVLIGVYEESGKLVGYKSDTFWSLTTHSNRAKYHTLERGSIPEVMVHNLVTVLNPNDGLFKSVCQSIKDKHFNNFESRLLGYELNGNLHFTHRIFPNDVQPLDDEDLVKLSETAQYKPEMYSEVGD